MVQILPPIDMAGENMDPRHPEWQKCNSKPASYVARSFAGGESSRLQPAWCTTNKAGSNKVLGLQLNATLELPRRRTQQQGAVPAFGDVVHGLGKCRVSHPHGIPLCFAMASRCA